MAVTYSPIAKTTGTGSSGVISFTSISGSYTDLILISSMYSTVNDQGIALTFNSDSGSNYSYTIVRGNGSGASSHRGTSQTNIPFFYNNGPGSTNGIYCPSIIHINNYSNTSTYKTTLSRSWDEMNTGNKEVLCTSGLWKSTSAITSITITLGSGSFTTGSTFTLYGVKAA